MFGYVTANRGTLTEQECMRYDGCYCGLCRVLSRKTGLLTAVCLNYDMTFLLLMLQSLYEPEEFLGHQRCVRHPFQKRPYTVSSLTDYAAAMTCLLSYEKCMDDWRDEKNVGAYLAALALRRPSKKAAGAYPVQAGTIRQELGVLYSAEADPHAGAEDAANAFGRILSALFCYQDDRWESLLRPFGMALGKFIYFMDAACDMEKDAKSGSYNACRCMGMNGPTDARIPLEILLGEATACFEQLPLVQDVNILRNILYSGVWAGYQRCTDAQKGELDA